MSDIKLSECLFVDLKTDAQRRDWFLLGRGVETGIIAPALQAHLVNAYSKIVESDKLIEQQQQRIEELENQLTQYRIDNLKIKADNNELSATIYRLRDALQTHTAQPICCGNVDIEYSPDGEPIGQQCCGWGDFEWPQDVVELLSATPQQNLNAVKREVAKKAFIAGSKSYTAMRVDGSYICVAELYANTRYPSGKDGE